MIRFNEFSEENPFISDIHLDDFPVSSGCFSKIIQMNAGSHLDENPTNPAKPQNTGKNI